MVAITQMGLRKRNKRKASVMPAKAYIIVGLTLITLITLIKNKIKKYIYKYSAKNFPSNFFSSVRCKENEATPMVSGLGDLTLEKTSVMV